MDQSQHNPFRPPARRLARSVTTALAVALVIAVVETLVRYNLATETFTAAQLALAAFANIALLGLPAILLAVTWYATVARIRPLTQPVRPARLTALTRTGVALAWAACTGLTAFAAAHTHGYVTRWPSPSHGNPPETPSDNPNILLVVLDTLRADRVGLYADSDLTPNLDALGDSSIVYTAAISTAPWTLPAHASLFTGLYPDQHGVNWGHYELDDTHPVLAELMAARGYRTFAISNNWLLDKSNGFDRGFEDFIETTYDPVLSKWRLALRCAAVQTLARAIGLHPDAAYDAGGAWTNLILRNTLERKAQSDRPFFAFVNYFEPHDPYRPPHRFAETRLTADQREAARNLHQGDDRLAAHACGVPHVYDPQDIDLMAALYDAEVAYQDQLVGDLLAMLRRQGLFENTWIVITSDHGELFGEGPGLYHTASQHYKLIHVPLIVRRPGGVAPRRIDAPVQLVDVFVTLAEAAGAQIPSAVTRAHRLPMRNGDDYDRTLCVAQTHGASIAGLAMAQRRSLQTNFSHWLTWLDSVYDGEFLLEIDNRGPRRLFHVAADPAMKTDLLHEQPETANRLLDEFTRWQAQRQKGDRPWRWVKR